MPKDLVESGHDLNAEPVGSGPFKFVSYTPRDSIKFVKNEAYYESGKPYFDEMTYRIVADPTALANGMKSGEINFSNEVPPKDWKSITSQDNMVDAALEGSRYYWMLPNHERGVLGDPLVRQAIAHALNQASNCKSCILRPSNSYVGWGNT